VEARSRFAATENRSPCPAKRSGDPHPGHPRPVASVSQREGLLALRLGASLRSYFPNLCSQRASSIGASEPWSRSCASCSVASAESSPALRPSIA
jgi:hypothetical protein